MIIILKKEGAISNKSCNYTIVHRGGVSTNFVYFSIHFHVENNTKYNNFLRFTKSNRDRLPADNILHPVENAKKGKKWEEYVTRETSYYL